MAGTGRRAVNHGPPVGIKAVLSGLRPLSERALEGAAAERFGSANAYPDTFRRFSWPSAATVFQPADGPVRPGTSVTIRFAVDTDHPADTLGVVGYIEAEAVDSRRAGAVRNRVRMRTSQRACSTEEYR